MTSVQIYLYLFIFPVKAICNVDTFEKTSLYTIFGGKLLLQIFCTT